MHSIAKRTVDHAVRLGPGLGVVSLITLGGLAAYQVGSHYWSPFPIGALTIAIVLGMLVANIFPLRGRVQPGIKFASRRILRLAIVLLGFRLSWSEFAQVGPVAIVIVLVASGITFGFTLLLGRVLRLPLKRALLLASGTCVCGASAIAAVDGCLRAKEEDVGVALAAVTLFGTIDIFVYPLINSLLHLAPTFYAFWTGASVHEVAQVAAAASFLSGPGQALASTVKLLRVLLILPITLILSLVPNLNRDEDSGETTKGKISVPWFAILFFVASAVASFKLLPSPIMAGTLWTDTVLLTAAMGALGLEIRFARFRRMEARTVWLGLLPTLFLAVISAVVTTTLVRG